MTAATLPTGTGSAVALRLLPIMAIVFVGFLVIELALPVLPLHVHDGFGLGPFVVGLVTGSQFATSLIARVWSGQTADSYGPKRAVVLGLAALECARPGSMIGYVGVPHGVEFDGQQLFFSQKGLLRGPAPVRRFLPHLMDLVLERKINPGKVFDLELPLADAAERCKPMDERRAIKTLLRL